MKAILPAIFTLIIASLIVSNPRAFAQTATLYSPASNRFFRPDASSATVGRAPPRAFIWIVTALSWLEQKTGR